MLFHAIFAFWSGFTHITWTAVSHIDRVWDGIFLWKNLSLDGEDFPHSFDNFLNDVVAVFSSCHFDNSPLNCNPSWSLLWTFTVWSTREFLAKNKLSETLRILRCGWTHCSIPQRLCVRLDFSDWKLILMLGCWRSQHEAGCLFAGYLISTAERCGFLTSSPLGFLMILVKSSLLTFSSFLEDVMTTVSKLGTFIGPVVSVIIKCNNLKKRSLKILNSRVYSADKC